LISEMDGVEATRLIKRDFPGTAVLALTTFDDDESIPGTITHGASGYFLKDISGIKLAEAIRDTVQGSVILPGLLPPKSQSISAGKAKRKHRWSGMCVRAVRNYEV
jgi:DNA-binding NarL/FixJ family response regulator